MNGIQGTLRFLSLAMILGAPSVVAAQEVQQEQPPPPPPDSMELVFEREVFTYPQYERRNPFLPLVGGDNGPRFEDLVLKGVVFSSTPGRSVALFGLRIPGGEGALGPTAFRVRRGETLGNVRILEIQVSRVVVEVVEFGLTEQRVMELHRLGQGGSS